MCNVIGNLGLCIGMSLLLGSATQVAFADSKDRAWIAELHLGTGADIGRRELQSPMDVDVDVDVDDIGQRLRSMREVDYIKSGVFVLQYSGGKRKCAQGLQRICPKEGQHWLHVKDKKAVRDRIAQARRLVGSQKSATTKYSSLRYNSSLYVYETATSQLLWERHWKKNEDLLLTTDNERIYAATKDSVSAYDIRTQRVVWSQHSLPRQEVKVMGQHEGKLLVQSGTTLAALNLATGRLLWDFNAGPSGDPWPQMVGGKAYVVVREALPVTWVCSGI